MMIQQIGSLLVVMSLIVPTTAMAQAWPTKPIEWIVPFAPGGSTDVLARLVADKLKDRLGQPIVIVNRGGANADIGYKAAAAAAPDGHTIVLTVPVAGHQPVSAQIGARAGVDSPRSSIWPKVRMCCWPRRSFLQPRSRTPIARIRSKPGAVSCGMTGGIGSLACQTLQSFAKSELLQVPYRGVEPATLPSWPAISISFSASGITCDAADGIPAA